MAELACCRKVRGSAGKSERKHISTKLLFEQAESSPPPPPPAFNGRNERRVDLPSGNATKSHSAVFSFFIITFKKFPCHRILWILWPHLSQNNARLLLLGGIAAAVQKSARPEHNVRWYPNMHLISYSVKHCYRIHLSKPSVSPQRSPGKNACHKHQTNALWQYISLKWVRQRSRLYP